jgi:hypothetical protein
MIRNMERFNQWPPAGFDGQFHWDFLKGAFGNKIMPMDLDGVTERNGRFLVFETKSESFAIPLGQKITLNALLRTGFFTIFYVVGKTPEEISYLEVWHGDHTHVVDPANWQSVYDYSARWFNYVNGLPPPTYPDQYESIISGLRQEIGAAKNKIQVLTEYVDRLTQSFRLESTKPKQPKKSANQSLSLSLSL